MGIDRLKPPGVQTTGLKGLATGLKGLATGLRGLGMSGLGSRRLGAIAIAFCAATAIAGCAKAPDADFNANAGAVPGSPQDFAQNVGDRVFFESDSSDLTPKAQATLDRQVAWLQRYNRGPFIIEGNADERGTREYNFALGARRAEASKDYMVARGIASSRVRTTSYGKERPVAVCNDISCWSQNRRAETHVEGTQS